MSYRVITDTCCDLSPEMYKELDLVVCPLSVLYKGEVCSEYTEQWLKDFYDGLRHGETATTSAVNIDGWKNAIEPVLKEGKDELDAVIKRIAGSYAYWYNWKYRRSGHLFQDRFKSEPVEDDCYYLTVLRYIHQNPVKANLCKNVEDYPYSSVQEYLNQPVLVDTSFTFSVLSCLEFIDYHKQIADDKCLEMEDHFRLTDEEAKQIIKRISKCKTVSDFQSLDIAERNAYLKKLHKNGLSIRQISRLTGVAKKIVEVNI